MTSNGQVDIDFYARFLADLSVNSSYRFLIHLSVKTRPIPDHSFPFDSPFSIEISESPQEKRESLVGKNRKLHSAEMTSKV